MTGEFQQYLAAKRSVDDRALDRRLLDRLESHLGERAVDEGPVTVLEVGAGTGTMVMRLLEWGVLPPGEIRYTAVDLASENIDALPGQLRAWAQDRAATVTGADPLVIETADRRVELTAAVDEAAAYADAHAGEFEVLIGAALLDIFELGDLGTLLGALSSDGLYYFPIIFDGVTRFLPTHPADDHVLSQYHEHMDKKPGGDSQAGQAVIERLQTLPDVTLSDVAGSDWFVQPVDGAYPADEAAFLDHILGTVESAVGELPDTDQQRLAEWVDTRRDQLESAELSYMTHQLDVLGRVNEEERNR